MRTVFRPYIKFITVPSSDPSGLTAVAVQLNDDRGFPISCNFVSVTTSCGTGAESNFLMLTPSGMRSNVPEGPSSLQAQANLGGIGASGLTASANTGSAASGILGDMCAANGGTAQLVLGIGDRVEMINLQNIGAGGIGAEIACMITYGNVNVQNTLKDGMFGRGT